MVKKSATRNGDAATASTSTHAQPVAGQDTEALFDPLFTLYKSKADFIDTFSTVSARQGFRLWVGEGRNLHDPEGVAAGRVELSCFKFRIKDENGKRTRIGGCRFGMKATLVYDKHVPVAERQWQFVAGIFEHNHDCGPPLSKPKHFGIRPPRMPPAKKTKTKPVPSAAKINTPETSSPPEEEATASPAAVVNRASRQKSESSATVESLVVGGGIVEKGDIAVLKAGAVSEETEARRSRTHSSSLALDDVDLINAVLATASLPIGHATLLSSDNTVIPDYRAFDFPRSLHTVALPIGHATLLSLDPHTPPFDDPFGFLHAPATNQSIELFLQAEGKDLEQYAPGFRMSGYDDTNSLLAPSDEVMSHFLVSSLVTLCPPLQSNPYQLRMMSSLVIAHRLQRSAPSFQNPVLGHHCHDSDVLPSLDHHTHESRGTKRSFGAVDEESNSFI